MTLRDDAVRLGIAAAALIVAGVAINTAPPENSWLEPISIAGQLERESVGRNIAATVHNARAADEVIAADGEPIPTDGVWIVVELSVRAVVDERAAGLHGVELHTGGIQYSPSDRVRETLDRGPLEVGIDSMGVLVFELPGVPEAAAELRLALSPDARGDSVLVFPLAFEEPSTAASVTLPPITLEAP
jgi:hypothetical protein